MLIGITGLTDSGKDEVLKIITDAHKNFIIINAGKIHSLLFKDADYVSELLRTFGQSIVNRDRSITRDSLSRVMLQGNENSQKLHEIIFRYGTKIIQDIQTKCPHQTYIIVDIGLLLNSSFIDICDKVIISTASLETRAKRLAERTQIPYEDALKRISLQREISYEKSNCAYITTDSNIDADMKRRLLEFLQK